LFCQTIACKICPAGYDCTNQAASPVACPDGKISSEGVAACSDCPAGQQCTDACSSPSGCSSGEYSPPVSTGIPITLTHVEISALFIAVVLFCIDINELFQISIFFVHVFSSLKYLLLRIINLM